MGLLETASGNSVWRGMDYYEELRKYVKSLSKAELQEQLYNALVEMEDRHNYW